MKHGNHQRRGIALIWTTVFLLIFIGFLGLALDTGWMVMVHSQLQSAADASSLAGARLVRQNQSAARLAAQTIGSRNDAGSGALASTGLVALQLNLNDPNEIEGDIVLGRFNRVTSIFTPTTTGPNAVKVNARRTASSNNGRQPLFFGPMYGENNVQATRSSIAMLAGGLGAGLLVLDPTGSGALHLQGGPDLQVLNGTIQVNSTSLTAVTLGGNWSLEGEELNITGAMNSPPTTLPVNFNMPPLPDPLAWLEAPSTSGMTAYNNVTAYNDPNATVNFTPGFYRNGLRIQNGTINFAPGTYVLGTPGQPNSFTNHGFYISGGTINAPGCTFYIAAGPVDFTANADINMSAPPLDEGHYYEHVTIFQARDNYSNSSIWAGNDSDIEGTLYFPGEPDATPPGGPQFDLNGGGFGVGVQVICYRMRLGGDADLDIFFDGWWPGPLLSRVFIVQ